MLNPKLSGVVLLLASSALASGSVRVQNLLRQQAEATNVTNSFDVASCPGYSLSSLSQTKSGLTAKLNLAGAECNAFGQDVANLTIQVTYETESRCVVCSCTLYRVADVQTDSTSTYSTPPTPSSPSQTQSSHGHPAQRRPRNPTSYSTTMLSPLRSGLPAVRIHTGFPSSTPGFPRCPRPLLHLLSQGTTPRR